MKILLNLSVMLLFVGTVFAQTTTSSPTPPPTSTPVYLYQDSIAVLKRQVEEQKKLLDEAEKIKAENKKLKQAAEQAKAAEEQTKAEAQEQIQQAQSQAQQDQNQAQIEAQRAKEQAQSQVNQAQTEAQLAKEQAVQAQNQALQAQQIAAQQSQIQSQNLTAQPQIVMVPQVESRAEAPTKEVIVKSDKDTLKSSNSSFTVKGNSVIIGNYNRIVIVDDQAKIGEAQRWLREGKEEFDTINSNYTLLKPLYKDGFFEYFSLSIGASTLGVGAELATTLSTKFRLRLGIDYFDYSIKDSKANIIDANLEDAVGYNPDYKYDIKPSFLNTHALIDWQPFRNGIFYITAGAYFGKNSVDVNGVLINPSTQTESELQPGKSWPTLNFDGYDINITDGRIDGKARFKNTVKPYFGIGLGRSVPRNRVGVLFEIGAMYQGGLVLEQNGVESTQNNNSEGIKILDNTFYASQFFPMAKFNLILRLN